MPNRLHNWAYKDVTDYLRGQGFQLNHTRGSHHYFIGHKSGKLRNVCVPYHGSVAIKPRTMKGIILQSGIDTKEWFNK
jgi:predicted RNA binding protein YcfA (HicA-like mRNA interferase family)